MYWTDYDTDEIQRANLDGSQVETLVTGVEAPNGIAIDAGAGKIYWTMGYGISRIRRANLDGSQVETIGTVTGSDIALDVGQGKMYLANWWEIIYRTGLSGSPVETLVPEAGASEAIGLDLSRGKMYWGGWRGIRFDGPTSTDPKSKSSSPDWIMYTTSPSTRAGASYIGQGRWGSASQPRRIPSRNPLHRKY